MATGLNQGALYSNSSIEFNAALDLGKDSGPIQVAFETPERWAQRYQRNNKRNGLKNLRCFPFCGTAHKDKGYCGAPVRVTVKRSGTSLPSLYAWSEFHRVNGDLSLKIGDTIALGELLSLERTRENPTRPYYRADVCTGEALLGLSTCNDAEARSRMRRRKRKDTLSSGSLGLHDESDEQDQRKSSVTVFDFNRLRRGWNYSWAANKHTCNELHALVIYLMVPTETEALRVISIHQSPTFQVFCRRRPNGLDDAAEQSADGHSQSDDFSKGSRSDGAQLAQEEEPIPKPLENGSSRFYKAKEEPNSALERTTNSPNQGWTRESPAPNQEKEVRPRPQTAYELPKTCVGVGRSEYVYPTQQVRTTFSHPTQEFNPFQIHWHQHQQHQQLQHQLQQQHPQYFQQYPQQHLQHFDQFGEGMERGREPELQQQQQQLQQQQQQQQQSRVDSTLDQMMLDLLSGDSETQSRDGQEQQQYNNYADQPILTGNTSEHTTATSLHAEGKKDTKEIRRASMSQQFFSHTQTYPQAQYCTSREDSHLEQFGRPFENTSYTNQKVSANPRHSESILCEDNKSSFFGIFEGAANSKRQRDHSEDDVGVDAVNKCFDEMKQGALSATEQTPKVLPASSPLRESMKPEDSYSQDPPPPAEVGNVLGVPEDIYEARTNARLWRLVLVLSLAEAHWHTQCPTEEPENSSSFLPDKSTTSSEQRKADAALSPENGPHSEHFALFYPNMSKDNRDIVASLANFLVNEQLFTRAISDALTALDPKAPMKEVKSAFIRVAHYQIERFCENHNISLAQFERLFEDKPSPEFLKHATTRLRLLQDTMRTYRNMTKVAAATTSAPPSKRTVAPPKMHLINGNGLYQMDEDLQAAHEHVREIRGIPWVLRKMIGFVEQRFTIEQVGYDEIIMKGNRKLMSNGINLYITDGQKRPFTMQSPVPWSKPLALYYHAWYEIKEECTSLHIVHYFEETERMQRIITHGPTCLYMNISYDVFENNEWVSQYRQRGKANLVQPHDGFNLHLTAEQAPHETANCSLPHECTY